MVEEEGKVIGRKASPVVTGLFTESSSFPCGTGGVLHGPRGRFHMGASYLHTCDRCKYSIRTSGPWEFYRNLLGIRRPFGHPSAVSRAASRRGVYGLSGELYCAKCDKVCDVILVEFRKPTHDRTAVWHGNLEVKDEYRDEDAVKCPECGDAWLILDPGQSEGVICPRCGEGRFAGEMEWVS